MTDKPVLIPGPDHPITIGPHFGRVIVRAGGIVIADSSNALVLHEGRYPPVFYVPRTDADMTLLDRSGRRSYCPYKGDASYFSIPALGASGDAAVWSYERPYPAVAAIADHLAFYPDRVTISAG